MEEKQIAGANYIFNFYNVVQTLTHNYSNYLIVLLELENKYGSEYNSKLGEEELKAVVNIVQNVRYYSNIAYIQYSSISKVLHYKTNEEVEQSFKKIKNTFIVEREQLEKYVTALNSFLVSDIIQTLLNNSQKFVSNLYDTEQQQPANNTDKY